MRAIRARYHPYVQARSRVDQLRRLGHSVDKVRPPPARLGAEAAELCGLLEVGAVPVLL